MNTKAAGMVLLLAASGGAGAVGQVPTFPTETQAGDGGRRGDRRQGTAHPGVEARGLRRQGERRRPVDPGVRGRRRFRGARPSPRPTTASPVATNASGDEPGRVFLVVLDDLEPRARLRRQPFARPSRASSTSSFARATGSPLAPTSGGAWWSGRMTRDRDDLLAALQALKGRRIPETRPERMSDQEAMLIDANRDREAIAHVAQRYALYGLLGPVPTRFGELGLPPVTGRRRGPRPRHRRRRLSTSAGADANDPAQPGAGHRRARGRPRPPLRHPRLRRVHPGQQADRVPAGAGGRPAVERGPLFPRRPRRPRARDRRPRPAHAAGPFVHVRGSRVRRRPPNAGADALAVDTGGFAISNTNDLGAGLGRLTRESRTFYLLGYEPADKRQDGRFRKIQVEVRRPGAVIHARKGYYAAGESRRRAAAEKPRPGSPDPAMARAVDSIVEERGDPLRMAAYVLGAAAEGRATVLLDRRGRPRRPRLRERGRALQGRAGHPFVRGRPRHERRGEP